MQTFEQEDKPAGYPHRILQNASQVAEGLQQGDKKTIKCVLVGDCDGKSSLVQTFLSGEPQLEYEPTIGEEYQVTYRWRRFLYPGIDIFLLCFSVMRSEGLQNIRDVWLPEIRGPCPEAQFLIIGLQSDQREEITDSFKPPVTKEQAINTAAELGTIKYLECSSKLNHGIREVFAEALLAGLGVVAARVEQPSAALVPSLRTLNLSGSIFGLSKKIFAFRERLQGHREPARLRSVREEEGGSSVQEDVEAGTESKLMITQEEQARASNNFEETLSGTWVYTHLDRRALLRASSLMDNATITSRTHSFRPTITASRRSVLSVPITWIPEDRRSIVSWGSAEHNATATLEIIEQYAANIESLQTELLGASLPPSVMNQSYNNVSLADNARAVLGDTHHHVTNNYVINYNLVIVSEATGSIGDPPLP